MLNTKQKGKAGENVVIRFLLNRGYVIVEQNFYSRGGEIDIIALDGDVYVFVEVKSRLEGINTEENALDAFSFSKQKKCIFAVNHYLSYKKIQNPYRIDLVIIFKRNGQVFLKHFQNFEVCDSLGRLLW